MMRTECDNCRKLGDSPPPNGWVVTGVIADVEHSGITAMFAGAATSRESEAAAIFCGWKCAAEYAAARAAIETVQGGESPS
jgi:hypothetical protein